MLGPALHLEMHLAHSTLKYQVNGALYLFTSTRQSSTPNTLNMGSTTVFGTSFRDTMDTWTRKYGHALGSFSFLYIHTPLHPFGTGEGYYNITTGITIKKGRDNMSK